MKKQAYTALAMITFVGLIAISTKAQTSSRTTLVTTIPFDFNVGEKVMPAGDYRITQVNPSSDRPVLSLRSEDGKRSVMIQMANQIGKPQDYARLVFRRYGSNYFFAEAWAKGEASGWRASKSRAERIAATRIGALRATENIALRIR